MIVLRTVMVMVHRDLPIFLAASLSLLFKISGHGNFITK